jgi:hypothetical protein
MSKNAPIRGVVRSMAACVMARSYRGNLANVSRIGLAASEI